VENRYSKFTVTTGDTADDHTNIFKLHIKLKIDFMEGMVKVDGSANYLMDRTHNNKQSRVTLIDDAVTHSTFLKPYALHENLGMQWFDSIPDIKVNSMIRRTLNG
jgi:hypothetical protein